MRFRRALYGGWWTVAVCALLIVLSGVGAVLEPARWPQAIASVVLAAFALAIALLAESALGLQRARLRAVERLARGHREELSVYAEHYTRVWNDMRALSPGIAEPRLADLNRDLIRLHALGVHIHRQGETDGA